MDAGEEIVEVLCLIVSIDGSCNVDEQLRTAWSDVPLLILRPIA